MFDVTVEWIDGKQEDYRQVPHVELGDHWLHLHYDLETYSSPMTTIRCVKVEKL